MIVPPEPVIKHTVLKTLLSRAASRKICFQYLDAEAALPNGDLFEEQKVKEWIEKTVTLLQKKGFQQIKLTPCLFTRLEQYMLIPNEGLWLCCQSEENVKQFGD